LGQELRNQVQLERRLFEIFLPQIAQISQMTAEARFGGGLRQTGDQ
jgi:hypothetical protein